MCYSLPNMTSRDFCYWLQGFFEIGHPQSLTVQETEIVKRHLALVFKHEIDPSMPDPTGELQATHDGKLPKQFVQGSEGMRC